MAQSGIISLEHEAVVVGIEGLDAGFFCVGIHVAVDKGDDSISVVEVRRGYGAAESVPIFGLVVGDDGGRAEVIEAVDVAA